jgi:ascorbate-specific PTS system EIIC-type component UlaA
MKKKGSKRKVTSVSSNKKKRKFFSFFSNNKVAPVVLAFVFLALALVLPFISTGNAVNSSITGQASNINILDTPINIPDSIQWLGLGNTWQQVIIFIIVLAIIFVMLFDMLDLVSIFTDWVSGVIAGGMAIIAALIGFIRTVVVWLITIGATMGILAGFLEIGVSIVIFVGLIFAGPKIGEFAARRKAVRYHIKGIKGTAEATTAISGLRQMGEELASRKPK